MPLPPLRLAVLVFSSCCSVFLVCWAWFSFLYPLDGPSKPFSLSVCLFAFIRSEHLTALMHSVMCLVDSSDVEVFAV